MATLSSPIPRSTVIWFGSLEFMSTGSGYDMILLSIKGPGGTRIAPTRMRALRRPHHHASPPKKRCGQHHHCPSASPRPAVRARQETAREPIAPRTTGTTAQCREDHMTTGSDAPVIPRCPGVFPCCRGSTASNSVLCLVGGFHHPVDMEAFPSRVVAFGLRVGVWLGGVDTSTSFLQ